VGFWFKATLIRREVRKTVPGVYLDFSAIANRTGSWCLAWLFDLNEVLKITWLKSVETRGWGVNEKGSLWKVGIQSSDEAASASDTVQYYCFGKSSYWPTSAKIIEISMWKISQNPHTINPAYRIPVNVHNLLSATVLAQRLHWLPDCLCPHCFERHGRGSSDPIRLLHSAKSKSFWYTVMAKADMKTFCQLESLKPYLFFYTGVGI